MSTESPRHALILAAGMGTRLSPLTKEKPKCLVRVAGQSIISRQLAGLATAGIEEVTIVAGYRADAVAEAVRALDTGTMAVTVIVNHEYHSTNNMYSAGLAADRLRGYPFLLANGDVAFASAIIQGIVSDPRGDLIGVDVGSFDPEAMKVSVSGSAVSDISKKIAPSESYGRSIDLYRFSSKGSEVFFGEIDHMVRDEGRRNDWTEVALQRLYSSGRLLTDAYNIGGAPWVEIDTMDDLRHADVAFASLDPRLEDKRIAFIDMDGTIYLGDQAIDGAAPTIQRMRERGIATYFVSNNSSRSRDQYVTRLASFGIEVSPEAVVISSDAALRSMADAGLERAFIAGTKALRSEASLHGIEHTSDRFEAVLLGYDTELTYERLVEVAVALQSGVPYYATHEDLVNPTPQGPIPDAGAFIQLLESVTGRRPDAVYGKPSRDLVEHILSELGAVGDECVVIGDRLYTDYELARNIGADFVCVLTGEVDRVSLESAEPFPDLVVDSIADLIPQSTGS